MNQKSLVPFAMIGGALALTLGSLTPALANCPCFTAASIGDLCGTTPLANFNNRFVMIEDRTYQIRCGNQDTGRSFIFSTAYITDRDVGDATKSCDSSELGLGGERPRDYTQVDEAGNQSCISELTNAAQNLKAPDWKGGGPLQVE